MNWLSQEAHKIHDYFESLFYVMVTVLLLVGVMTEYFSMPLGIVPSFSPLVGRVLVAAILLHTYPEISRIAADISDAMAGRLGDLNQFKLVLNRMGDKLGTFSFSWVSVKGSLILFISFIGFFLLYFSVHVTQAFLLYTWTILYVFSPLLIALYVLPQTAAATSALYRSLFEAACWKVVWAVLASLLWSAGVSQVSQENVIAAICFNLVLAGSLVLTPLVVHQLAGGGVSSMAKTVGSVAVGGITTVTPGKVARLANSYGKQGYNYGLDAASVISRPSPRINKWIEAAPRFRVPPKPTVFAEKNKGEV